MEQLILIVHVLAAVAIIGLILIQQGKGADMGASFGAGASQTLFGSSGSGNVLTKSTTILVALFFATSFGLAVVAKNKAVSAGDVDIPVPAVVEKDSLPADDFPEDSSSVMSEAAQGDIPSLDAAGGDDVPALEEQPAGDDLPASDLPE